MIATSDQVSLPHFAKQHILWYSTVYRSTASVAPDSCLVLEVMPESGLFQLRVGVPFQSFGLEKSNGMLTSKATTVLKKNTKWHWETHQPQILNTSMDNQKPSRQNKPMQKDFATNWGASTWKDNTESQTRLEETIQVNQRNSPKRCEGIGSSPHFHNVVTAAGIRKKQFEHALGTPQFSDICSHEPQVIGSARTLLKEWFIYQYTGTHDAWKPPSLHPIATLKLLKTAVKKGKQQDEQAWQWSSMACCKVLILKEKREWGN